MFRLSKFMKEIVASTPLVKTCSAPGPVVIWNLVRRCNLKCKHCYSISGDVDFPGELNTSQIFSVMDDLKAFKVPVLILSGGEPLLRSDIFDTSKHAKASGFYVGLSSNGTRITKDNIDDIADVGYDYLGISLDGIGETNDRFRGKIGAFDEALNGIRLALAKGIKVGMRFTATMDNIHQLKDMLELMDKEKIDKFYLSHLSYAGRGNKNRQDDAAHVTTRLMMDTLFKAAYEDAADGGNKEFVTGNNDADGAYLLLWVKRNFPEKYDHIRAKLVQWGGNSTGVNIANIDNLGDVHPDTMWWHYKIGNVTTRKFGDIWSDLSDPVMAGLKQSPRIIKGRCSDCRHFDICGGNTRVRAMQLTGDPWDEDPACYLSDTEIGLKENAPRLRVTPFRGVKHAASVQFD
ncbi:MAG: heme d1 biosynthesis radical SAM protein NirJ [Hyphomicrobiales bacterium]|nr:heme d1 biosynthesis radical SAM protein NirJ [Hyphomicrobiales bacterium]